MRPVETVLARVNNVREQGAGWIACCPAHEDKNPSLSIGEGENGKVLLKCFAGCRPAAICEVIGLTMSDLMGLATNTSPGPLKRFEEAYDYRDEAGNLLFQVIRYEPKTFRQRRPNEAGGWVFNIKGIRRVPYRLPELLQNLEEVVFVVEGEKDVHALEGISCLATCNAGGGLKWDRAHAIHLKDRNVVILPDNDQTGRQHAEQVAESLQDIAKEVKLVPLPDLPEKGDVSDWIAAGGTKERLIQFVLDAPLWEAKEQPNPEPLPPSIEAFLPFPLDVIPQPVRDFICNGAKAIPNTSRLPGLVIA